MGRRPSRETKKQQVRTTATSILKAAMGTFLGGLLLYAVTQLLFSRGDKPATPTPAATVAPVVEREPTFTPTRHSLPTATVIATPSPATGHCPARLDSVRGTAFMYRVSHGDTPCGLVSCFGGSRDELMQFNWILDPTELLAGTYIVVPSLASGGDGQGRGAMLRDGERVAIEAFNAMIADMLVHWPNGPEGPLTDHHQRTDAVQSAASWVDDILARYKPNSVLSARYEWNLPPTIADPDFGWQPWQRGAYATVVWTIRLRLTSGAQAELTLYQSVHYGFSASQAPPEVTRFQSLINRYSTITVLAS